MAYPADGVDPIQETFAPKFFGERLAIARDIALPPFANGVPFARVGAVRPGLKISSDLGQPCAHNLLSPHAREADQTLAARLLDELEFPAQLLGDEAEPALADLNGVLAADYLDERGFPSDDLAQELVRIVDHFITPYTQIWNCWQDRLGIEQLRRVFNWGDVIVTARPYTEGAGRALWGFSGELESQGRRRRVIFLNTAHERGAIAATMGHELGHHVYDVILGRCAAEEKTEGLFTRHLSDEQELLPDALVAVSAYSQSATRAIIGGGLSGHDAARVDLLQRYRQAFATVDAHYRIDLERDDLAPLWRLRYLTLIVHLFKLRCALLEAAGI